VNCVNMELSSVRGGSKVVAPFLLEHKIPYIATDNDATSVTRTEGTGIWPISETRQMLRL
jgi:hypothetical protein